MAAVDDFDEVLQRFKLAGNEFMKGNPVPVQELFSHRDDVSLANPFGPPARGWDEVAMTQERGASYYRDGEIYDFETVAKYVTPELACMVAPSAQRPARPSAQQLCTTVASLRPSKRAVVV